MIAIKQLTEEDEQAFQEFLKTERRTLPKLHMAPLPFPHEAIVVLHHIPADNLEELAQSCGMVLKEVDAETTVLTCRPVFEDPSGTCAFSGYVLKDGVLTFGAEEFLSSGLKAADLKECYGEFNLLHIGGGRIELLADFFGMSPWYYYADGMMFAASNHYHLLLEALKQCGVHLTMNIRRSRVNIITSDYTYSSNFTTDMDVNNCYLSLPYEVIAYDTRGGVLTKEKTELYQILTTEENWDEDLYEDYLRKAKEEIYENTLAYFSSDRFKQIVIDISGGFDSRIVFATANNLPRRLRRKIATHTRRSGTKDDVEKAAGVTNLYNYKKVRYQDIDDSDVMCGNEVDLAQISRSLGSFSVNTNLYLNHYDKQDRLQLTGGIGDAVFGYKRIRGELKYSIGDRLLLSWLGGCYLHNSVKQLKGVFADQENIILASIEGYNCNDLFKKFHVLYVNYRNRLNFGNAHNIEYDNFRASPLHSKYALKAKWMYFRRFDNNKIPDEKISIDLLTMINPLLATVPFASNNDDVIPPKENLLWNITADVKPDFSVKASEPFGDKVAPENLYRSKVVKYMSDLLVAEQMLLQIYDYSHEYEPVCLGLYRVLREFRDKPEDLRSSHGVEQIRKIYDVYYQMKICDDTEKKPEESSNVITPPLLRTIFEREDNKIVIESVYTVGQKLKADIVDNGVQRCLWFHYSDNYQPEALNADAFLIYLVRYAMIHDRDIVSKVPVHYELLNSINRLLIPAVRMADGNHAKMKVSAPVLPAEDCHQASGVATGLSCGVDSFYALLNHYRTGDSNLDVTHLFFFDMFHTDINHEWETFNYCQKVAAEMGFSLIRMCTNVLQVLNMNWFPMHLYSLFAGVNSMQNIIGKYYLASGYHVTNIDMHNPLWVDPAHFELLLIKAFHHKGMELYIEGPVTRLDKTDFIADFPIVQNRLSVCWPRPYDSCGICPKCVRTLVDLDACGKLDKFGAVFDLTHYKANRDWYLSFARSEYDYGNILYQESLRRLKARGEDVTETFEDKMIEIIYPQSAKMTSYFETKKLKSVLFFGRRYDKFVDELADILSGHDIKVYIYVKDRNPNLPAVARERVNFVRLEQLSTDMATGIDVMILTSLTLNLKSYSGLFNKMERGLRSSVHLSEIIDIPFFKGKEVEVQLNKVI